MAVAIPFSLIIWLSSGKTLFYTVGIVEAILLVAAFVTSIVCRKKESVSDIPSGDAEEAPEENQSEEE